MKAYSIGVRPICFITLVESKVWKILLYPEGRRIRIIHVSDPMWVKIRSCKWLGADKIDTRADHCLLKFNALCGKLYQHSKCLLLAGRNKILSKYVQKWPVSQYALRLTCSHELNILSDVFFLASDSNRRSDSQRILSLLWNPKVYYRVHKNHWNALQAGLIQPTSDFLKDPRRYNPLKPCQRINRYL